MESETTMKRVGFIIESGSPAREDALIYDMDKTAQIGKVCSGTFSPCLKKPIGMAFVNTANSKLGTQIKVVVRNKDNVMKLSKMPFVPSKYYKKKTE
jgi:aminomethyltransferase